MSENLREKIASAILANFNPPDDKHSTWWINTDVSADAVLAVVGPRLAALESALLRTERNFRLAVNGKPVRDMSENLAENARALGGVS